MITAIILARNVEKNIEKCLETLSWCRERIIIDDNSNDKTVEIASRMGAKVFVHSLSHNFAKQRNYGLEKAKGGWVLFIDADERVSSSLREEIIKLTNKLINKYDGFYIKRKDYMWGKELRHGETADIKLLRLAKKDAGKWQGKVHEVWKVKGEIGELNNPLLHFPHQSIEEFLGEINKYTSIRSKELCSQGARVSFVSIIIYPLSKFVLNYLLKGGFRDGIEGLVTAMIMSLHSFLVRAKLWQLWQTRD